MKRNSWPNPCNWVKSICSNFETHNRFRIETFASVTQTLKCRRRSMSAVDRETAAVHFTASVVIHSPERLQFLSIWRWWTRENEQWIWKRENSRHSEWEFFFFFICWNGPVSIIIFCFLLSSTLFERRSNCYIEEGNTVAGQDSLFTLKVNDEL